MQEQSTETTDTNPVAPEAAPALPAPLEKIKTGISYTKDGPRETYMMIEPGNPSAKPQKGYEPLEYVEFQGYPKGWRNKHLQGFHALCLMVFEIKKQKDRQVPVLRLELEQHVDKQVVKDLEKMGVIGSQLIQLMNQGGRMGGRVVVWLTPYGRAIEQHIHQQIKAAQALDEKLPAVDLTEPVTVKTMQRDDNTLRDVLGEAQVTAHESAGVTPEQLTGNPATTGIAAQLESKS